MARRRSRKKKTDEVQADINEAAAPQPAISPETESKISSQISQWNSDGYSVQGLEEMLRNKDPAVAQATEDAERNIKSIEELKKLLGTMNISGLDADAESLLKLMREPSRMQEIQSGFEALKKKMRARDITKELETITMPALRERVEALKVKLGDISALDDCETEFADIRRVFKEKFYEESIAIEVEKAPAAERPAAEARRPEKSAEPMVVNDIFLLYKDGKFISHHTTRTAGREEQTEIFSDLRTVRNYIRSPKYLPRRLNVINIDSKKIVVLSGGYLIVVLTVTGDVNPWTDRIVGKVINLMEREDEQLLRTWTGDPANLKSIGKYMTALLYACVKLGKKEGNGGPPPA